MKRLCTIMMLLPAIWQVTAQNRDYIYSDYEIENGTIYTGYTSCVSCYEKTMTIDARIVLKLIPAKEACISSEEKGKRISELSEDMRTWFENHPHLLQATDSFVTVGDIKINEEGKEIVYKGAVLLEQRENIKFVATHKEEVTIKSQALRATTKMKLPDNVLSGTKEFYRTKDGKQWQIVRLERDSILVVDDNGTEETICRDDIMENLITLVNSNQPYIKQIPFIQTVVTNTAKYEGYITKQVYASSGKSSYIIIRTGDSCFERVEYDDIREIRRSENLKFQPVVKQKLSIKQETPIKTDMEAGQYTISDSIVAKTLPSKVRIEGTTCYIEEDINQRHNVVRLSSAQIKSEIKLRLRGNAESHDFVLVPVTLERNHYKKQSHFSLYEKKTAARHENEDGIDTYVFHIGKATGYYAIYNQDTHKVIIIHVN